MKKFDIIGIGAALLDIVVDVEDSFLTERSIVKGHMALMKSDALKDFYSALKIEKHDCGGATANSLATASLLGATTGLVGALGTDSSAEHYINDLTLTNVEWLGTQDDAFASGECVTLITPDGQRSMMTALGASASLTEKDLPPDALTQTKTLLLEGYLWDSESAKAAAKRAAEIVRSAGGLIVLNLSDALCVERHFDAFHEFVRAQTDVLLGNETEAKTFYQTQDENKIIDAVKQAGLAYAAITRGEKGAYVFEKDQCFTIAPHTIKELVDSTGAGDAFAGGFLYGLCTDKGVEASGVLGAQKAAEVIQHFGARP